MHAASNMRTEDWRRKSRLALLVVAGMALTACTSGATQRPPADRTTVYPPAEFVHRVATSDVEIYWNCSSPEPGLLRVNGVVKNTGGHEVRFLELELVGVSAKEQNLLQAAAAVPDVILHTNQISPFQLDLRTGGKEVRYDLYYQYRVASSLGLVRPRSSLSASRFMARDVCSETQHRVSNIGK